jgi:hypothetical protein
MNECGKSGNLVESMRHERYRRLMQHCFVYQLPMVVTTRLAIHDRHGDLVDWIGYQAWQILCRMAPPESVIDLGGMPTYCRKRGESEEENNAG